MTARVPELGGRGATEAARTKEDAAGPARTGRRVAGAEAHRFRAQLDQAWRRHLGLPVAGGPAGTEATTRGASLPPMEPISEPRGSVAGAVRALNWTVEIVTRAACARETASLSVIHPALGALDFEIRRRRRAVEVRVHAARSAAQAVLAERDTLARALARQGLMLVAFLAGPPDGGDDGGP